MLCSTKTSVQGTKCACPGFLTDKWNDLICGYCYHSKASHNISVPTKITKTSSNGSASFVLQDSDGIELQEKFKERRQQLKISEQYEKSLFDRNSRSLKKTTTITNFNLPVEQQKANEIAFQKKLQEQRESHSEVTKKLKDQQINLEKKLHQLETQLTNQITENKQILVEKTQQAEELANYHISGAKNATEKTYTFQNGSTVDISSFKAEMIKKYEMQQHKPTKSSNQLSESQAFSSKRAELKKKKKNNQNKTRSRRNSEPNPHIMRDMSVGRALKGSFITKRKKANMIYPEVSTSTLSTNWRIFIDQINDQLVSQGASEITSDEISVLMEDAGLTEPPQDLGEGQNLASTLRPKRNSLNPKKNTKTGGSNFVADVQIRFILSQLSEVVKQNDDLLLEKNNIQDQLNLYENKYFSLRYEVEDTKAQLEVEREKFNAQSKELEEHKQLIASKCVDELANTKNSEVNIADIKELYETEIKRMNTQNAEESVALKYNLDSEKNKSLELSSKILELEEEIRRLKQPDIPLPPAPTIGVVVPAPPVNIIPPLPPVINVTKLPQDNNKTNKPADEKNDERSSFLESIRASNKKNLKNIQLNPTQKVSTTQKSNDISSILAFAIIARRDDIQDSDSDSDSWSDG